MRVRTFAVAAAATLMAIVTPVLAAPPAAAAPQPYVLYYTAVNTSPGGSETLWTIAARFLGAASRAGEILDLNSGRVQPDGARLTDPGTVHAGWNLVLPWDAIGSDLHYGVLPAVTATPSAGPSTRPSARQPSARPPVTPARPATPARLRTVAQAGAGAGGKASLSACAPVGRPEPAWGQQQLNPGRAWHWADGTGIRLAVVDSGVDGTRVDLAGRVVAGADIAGGTGRGDADCIGSGTAIALFAAADDGAGGRKYGVAPKATVVPIRLVGREARVPAGRAATAVEVAVSTGAQVIVLGSYVDMSDAGVRKAVNDAIAHNVVVVMPVGPKLKAAKTTAGPADGLLRVGGVGADRATSADYPAGSVDLVAPGPGPYAAAFVAGTVALVRSNHPDLSAVESARQVLRTATSWQQPEKYGAGLVSPADAVSKPLPAGVQRALAADARDRGGDGELLGAIALVAAVVLVVLLIVVLWLGHIRRARTAERERERATERQDDPFNEKADAEFVGGTKKV